MKFQNKIYCVVNSVAVALFAVLSLVFSQFDVQFWVCFVATVTLLAIQTVVVVVADKNCDKKLFNILSSRGVGYVSSAISVSVATAFCAVRSLPSWVGALVVALFGILTVVSAFLSKQPAVLSKDSFIRQATVDAEVIMSRAATEQLKALSKNVYEALRYSDPVSDVRLQPIEEKIGKLLSQFSIDIDNNDLPAATEHAKTLIRQVEERNIRCKAYKQKS